MEFLVNITYCTVILKVGHDASTVNESHIDIYKNVNDFLSQRILM